MEERKFLNIVWSVLDKKEQLVFKDKITFFEESMSEYKHILRHFCHKISLDSYVHRKT